VTCRRSTLDSNFAVVFIIRTRVCTSATYCRSCYLCVYGAVHLCLQQVVHEMLVTSDGCELYLLAPAAFGFSVGEQLAFAEVQEVGRLLHEA